MRQGSKAWLAVRAAVRLQIQAERKRQATLETNGSISVPDGLIESGPAAPLLESEDPPAPQRESDWLVVRALILSNPVNILLLSVPLGIVAGLLEWPALVVFSLNFLGLVPLALLLGDVTEDLAVRFGETIGGLLNATFGNVVEMILSVAALQKGLVDVVATSLIGSILSNLLLVLGCSFLFGGMYHSLQNFNALANRACNSLLFLSTIGIIIPSAAHQMLPIDHHQILTISRGAALILFLCYVCYLTFQLLTHKHLFEGEDEGHEPMLSLSTALIILTIITVSVAFSSEYLTGAIEKVSEKTGLSRSFLGMIVLPIAGNACEHITAVLVAMKGKMDLSLGVAVGSSIQIAIFTIPLMVLVSWMGVGPKPFGMDFEPFATVALTVSVIHANFVTADPTSHWLMGVQLVATYIIIATTYYFLPNLTPAA